MNPDLTLTRPITTGAWPRDLPCGHVPATRSLCVPVPVMTDRLLGPFASLASLVPRLAPCYFHLNSGCQNFFFLIFWLYPTTYGTLVLQPGIEPMLPSWEGEVLTAGLLVKSLGINCFPFTPRGSLAKWLSACILALNYLGSSFACSYLGDTTVTPLPVPHFVIFKMGIIIVL